MNIAEVPPKEKNTCSYRMTFYFRHVSVKSPCAQNHDAENKTWSRKQNLIQWKLEVESNLQQIPSIYSSKALLTIRRKRSRYLSI